MASTKTILSTAASAAATAMLIRSIAHDFIPHNLQNYFFSAFHRFFLSRFSSQHTITVKEFEGFSPNQIFQAAEIYLGTKFSLGSTAGRLRASKQEKDNNISVAMERGEGFTDTFEGIQIKWSLIYGETTQIRHFLLSFHQKHKAKVLDTYVPHVLNRAKAMKDEKKGVKLYMVKYENMLFKNFGDVWGAINLDHPATFQTLAMDQELKGALMADLDRFVKRRDYYKKVGKAWKRGYLLHGSPGTEKSSLIAAMANYLNFNIYDLELLGIPGNSELRKLLLATANRSILVVQDIDCTIDFKSREGNEGGGRSVHGRQQDNGVINLSGFLNFIDGLWSSCGDERIIIFTTNHKEKLDPALLQPGKMDFHIHMSYCTPNIFKALAFNYLTLQHHHLFEEIEDLIQEVNITPAQVAEELMKHRDPLEGLVEFLRGKKKRREEGEEKDEEEDDEYVVRRGRGWINGGRRYARSGRMRFRRRR